MILGITGSSGSGKSMASAFFEKKGFFIIDFDKISRKICEKGSPCLKKLTDYFGDNIIDESGNLKRKYLGDVVFKDHDKLEYLTRTTHKYILKEAAEIKADNEGKNIIYDAPLLFESGIDAECDVIISIICDEKTKIQRIMKRDFISYETAASRIKSQKENKYYIDNSDYYIENNSSTEDFLKKLECVFRELKLNVNYIK